jgi:hypothetical protein
VVKEANCLYECPYPVAVPATNLPEIRVELPYLAVTVLWLNSYDNSLNLSNYSARAVTNSGT